MANLDITVTPETRGRGQCTETGAIFDLSLVRAIKTDVGNEITTTTVISFEPDDLTSPVSLLNLLVKGGSEIMGITFRDDSNGEGVWSASYLEAVNKLGFTALGQETLNPNFEQGPVFD